MEAARAGNTNRRFQIWDSETCELAKRVAARLWHHAVTCDLVADKITCGGRVSQSAQMCECTLVEYLYPIGILRLGREDRSSTRCVFGDPWLGSGAAAVGKAAGEAVASMVATT